MANAQKITPCLWFDTQAEAAAAYYTSLFEGSEIGAITRYSSEGQEIHGQPEGLAMTVPFTLAGYQLLGLNGGTAFTLNPAISLFVVCETEAEADRLWQALSDGGAVLMEYGKYDWSEKYGWLSDRYGLSWQISLGRIADVGQKITPMLLFTREQAGRAEEAITLYTSLFENSGVSGMLRYGAGQAPDKEGSIMHAQFRLSGEAFMAMDSAHEHAFKFNEAVSLMIDCESQAEVDHFWQQLTDGGEEGPCGWLKDRFGVSWQVVPRQLPALLLDPDPEKVARVTRAVFQMQKLDIAALERAYTGA